MDHFKEIEPPIDQFERINLQLPLAKLCFFFFAELPYDIYIENNFAFKVEY
jgi:hypothetical protein